MNNPFSLSGKVIFVTGASSGIGQSIAIESAKMGAELIISGRNAERLNETFCQLEGSNNTQLVAELTKPEDIDFIVEQLPCLDGVVLNAGVLRTVPVKYITDSAIEEVFNTNIISSIKLVQKLLKSKKINKGASIVFISSISSFSVKVGNSLYSATKGAINSFMKVLALELASKSITVNSIQPGFIKTRALDSGIITDEQLEDHFKIYPLGIGKPTDIAYACIYLLSDAAEWVTGSIFTIDGGVTSNGGH
jgi:NAD(P)-dependent dehydrogenase (short-subunit alcohol dehydrogenase family)